MREPLGSSSAGIFLIQLTISYCHILCLNMANCTVCGEKFDNDIRFLNHMMEKHGFRNPNMWINQIVIVVDINNNKSISR